MQSCGRFESRQPGRLGAGVLVAACLLLVLTAPGCVTTNEVSKAAPNDPEFKGLLDDVGRVYESRDVPKIMDWYVGDTYSLSFDQTHAFDSGATDHRSTVERLLDGVQSVKVVWDPDVAVDRTSERVWTTRHFVATAKMAGGDERKISGWHSAVWVERDHKWLIEYEHFRADTQTAAAPPPPPPPPAAAAPPVAAETAARDSIRDIFFDYDKWDIRNDQLEGIGVVLAYLEKYPTTEITIEGHCDERGSTRYNIRLGEKRANETKAWLVGHGIAPERLRTVSFGKSRPFEQGRSEDAWQSNRRSHFVITKGPNFDK